MKKMKFLLLLLPLIGLAGCVKQKNCDCGIEGNFIYYPESKTGTFYQDGYMPWEIEGHIPRKVQSTILINVNACIINTKNIPVPPNQGKFECVEVIE